MWTSKLQASLDCPCCWCPSYHRDPRYISSKWLLKNSRKYGNVEENWANGKKIKIKKTCFSVEALPWEVPQVIHKTGTGREGPSWLLCIRPGLMLDVEVTEGSPALQHQKLCARWHLIRSQVMRVNAHIKGSIFKIYEWPFLVNLELEVNQQTCMRCLVHAQATRSGKETKHPCTCGSYIPEMGSNKRHNKWKIGGW